MSGGGIVFVRHALPEVDPSLPSGQWTLPEASREDCVLLAHALSGGSYALLATSPEPKAIETARVLALRLGLDVVEDRRLGEATNPWSGDGYREAAARYLAGAQTPPGWEERGSVQARFAAAIRAHSDATGAGDLIVVDHGMAMCLFLATHEPRIGTRDGGRAWSLIPFWQALAFPDAWRWDRERNELARVFEGGQPPPDG